MVPSLTQNQVDSLLRAFLLDIMPAGVEVVIAQNNRVPEPSADNFVLLTALSRRRLATNIIDWDKSPTGNPTAQNNIESSSIGMQLDFHGAASTDNAQTFATLFRSEYAYDFLSPSGLYPDYCTDGAQMPFINAEKQWETRWVVNAIFDANIIVTTAQEFANTVSVGLIEVDTVYPP